MFGTEEGEAKRTFSTNLYETRLRVVVCCTALDFNVDVEKF